MRPIRFLYWNTGKKDKTQEQVLTDLFAADGVPDVVLLGECEVDLSTSFLKQYGLKKVVYKQPPGSNQTQLAYFKTQPDFALTHLVATTIRAPKKALRYGNNPDLTARVLLMTLTVASESTLVACVHLPSRRGGLQDEPSQLGLASRYKGIIAEAAGKPLSDFGERIVVVGDFNMNPFDLGMIEPTAFFAINNRKFVRHQRKVAGVNELMFYNPCWTLLSDINQAMHPTLRVSGSIYYTGTASKKLYWHLFDQVLLSESLIKHFDASALQLGFHPKIEKEVMSSVTRKNADYSDHLPLCFTLNF
jgi:exonuclease III